MPSKSNRLSGIAIIAAAITLAAALTFRRATADPQPAAPAPTNPAQTGISSPPAGFTLPSSSSPNNQATPAPSAAAAAPPAQGGLTSDTLKTMLDNMGLDVKDGGNGVWYVGQSRDNWNLNVNISVSQDQTVLWFYATFSAIPDIDKVPASVWKNLLLCNAAYGVTFCIEQPAQGQPYLELQHAIENRGITPQIMKKNLDLMFDSVVNDANWWDQSKWPKAGATTAP
jgi:hypothetical protein